MIARLYSRCDGLSRRGVLRLGQLTGLGIGLSQLNAVSVASVDARRSAKSCILIWLDGGPSHLETFDLKPNAAKEVRGPLEAIATAVPGIFISECMPQTAQRMNDIAVIRSMTSPLGEHNLGTHYLLTGYRPTPVLQYPSFHAVANQRLRSKTSNLPNNVAIPDYRVGGAKFSGAGFLPSEFGPFSLGADPAKADFRVRDLDLAANLTLERIDRRRAFADQLARWNSGDAVTDMDRRKLHQRFAWKKSQRKLGNDTVPELSVKVAYWPDDWSNVEFDLSRSIITDGTRTTVFILD
jgi:hypothetical protein